jgi:hypothetical protein
MLCGFRLRLDSLLIKKLLQDPTLEFEQKLNLETGELNYPISWSKDGITILIKSSRFGVIKGSLHMYKNAGRHNYDDFTLKQVIETIDKLSNRLKIRVDKLQLITLEWGFNLQLNVPPTTILSRLVSHQNKAFERLYVFPGNNYMCHHHTLDIKVYDKSAQNIMIKGVPKNIMRIECSTNHARVLHQLGIYCLQDIKKPNKVIEMFEFLQDLWTNVLLIEPGLESFENENHSITKWSNPRYWASLSRQDRFREKNRYQEFLLSKGLCFQEDILFDMYAKFEELRHLQY